jgi:hypothetical protein
MSIHEIEVNHTRRACFLLVYLLLSLVCFAYIKERLRPPYPGGALRLGISLLLSVPGTFAPKARLEYQASSDYGLLRISMQDFPRLTAQAHFFIKSCFDIRCSHNNFLLPLPPPRFRKTGLLRSQPIEVCRLQTRSEARRLSRRAKAENIYGD